MFPNNLVFFSFTHKKCFRNNNYFLCKNTKNGSLLLTNHPVETQNSVNVFYCMLTKYIELESTVLKEKRTNGIDKCSILRYILHIIRFHYIVLPFPLL